MANWDPQIKEDEVVIVVIAGPVQGPPWIEAMEECAPCKAVTGLWRKPDSDAIINESFEKLEAGFVAWNQVFYF